MSFLTAFMDSQLYRLVMSEPVSAVALAIFDVVVVALAYREFKRFRDQTRKSRQSGTGSVPVGSVHLGPVDVLGVTMYPLSGPRPAPRADPPSQSVPVD